MSVLSRTRWPALTRTQGWTLLLSGAGSFVVVLDLLAVSTALPALRADLHASVATLAWAIDAYTLSFAVLLVTAATLGDRWGRRELYAAGLGLFTVASAACALAPGAGVLLAARAVQGAGAAVIMPLALALLNAAFPAGRRGWAMGVYGSITGLATVTGPVLGGALTEALSWQWIFWLNVPVGLAAMVAVRRFLPRHRGTRRPLDPAALVLTAVGVFGLVWGIIRATAAGWGDPTVIGPLAGGGATLLVLVGAERRARYPMIPLRLFTVPAFAAGGAAILLQSASLTATVFFTAQFFQDAQGGSPLAAGLRLLPLGVAPLLIAPYAGALADRLGSRPLIITGLLVQGAGIAALARLGTPDRWYPQLAWPLLLVGAGLTLAVPALTRAVVGSVGPADIGIAAGLFTALRQLGGAFGVAAAATAFATTGGFGTPGRVADGFRTAMYLAAGLSAAAALVSVHRTR